jgi:hypothetical protein
MKANELRIGNWVEQPNDGVTRVTAILNDLQIKTETGYIDKYCRPIPLTEEWLVKFGFEKDILDIDSRYILEGKHYTFTSNWLSEEIIYVNLNETHTDIQYLHQLQNLYFALTGEELTIKEKQDA